MKNPAGLYVYAHFLPMQKTTGNFYSALSEHNFKDLVSYHFIARIFPYVSK